MSLPLAALSGTSATATTSAARPSPALLSTTTADPSLWLSKRHGCPQLREYCPRAFGTWAIFPQLREKGLSLTIDLDASHYLHIISDFYRARTLRFGPFWISMRRIYKDWYWKPKSLMYVIWTLSILHTIPGVHITFVSSMLYSCILLTKLHVHEPIFALAAIVSDVCQPKNNWTGVHIPVKAFISRSLTFKTKKNLYVLTSSDD